MWIFITVIDNTLDSDNWWKIYGDKIWEVFTTINDEAFWSNNLWFFMTLNDESFYGDKWLEFLSR